uniref:Uncharacterized protein n=1 Tax=Salvator merianae TaxID=96440 RepID=A0A8D0CC31_SALMN
MQPRKNKSAEYLEAFSKPSLHAPKTSAEIVNEARKALRTLGTQRPFTPRETQRKLFGPASSRTPENRPPSAFSLHASSFESVESRPVSSIRLSPLDHKPKFLASPQNDEEHPICPPMPPLNSRDIRKTSSPRVRLLRTASYGNLLFDAALLPKEGERLSLEDQFTMCDTSRSVNERFSANSAVQLSSKDNCLPQMCREHHKTSAEEICPQKTAIPSPLQCSSQRDQLNSQGLLSLNLDSTEWINSANKSALDVPIHSHICSRRKAPNLRIL